MNNILANLPLLILWAILLFQKLRIEKCSGMPDGLLFSFLIILITIIQIGLWIKKRKSTSIKTIVSFGIGAVILIVSTILIDFEFVRSEIRLQAVMVDGTGELILRKNNKYEFREKLVEATCTYTGEYEIVGDTLALRTINQNLLQEGISKSYLITEGKLISQSKINEGNSKNFKIKTAAPNQN